MDTMTGRTDRVEAERALQNSEEHLQFLYARIPALVHSIDQEGRIVQVSDRWLGVLRYSRDEIIGRKSVEVLTEDSRRYAETVALPEFWRTGEALANQDTDGYENLGLVPCQVQDGKLVIVGEGAGEPRFD